MLFCSNVSPTVQIQEVKCFFYLGYLPGQFTSKSLWSLRKNDDIARIVFDVCGHHVYQLWLVMKPVVSQLLDGPGGNNEYAGQSQGKTNEAQNRMAFEACNGFDRGFELIPDHNKGFLQLHGVWFKG